MHLKAKWSKELKNGIKILADQALFEIGSKQSKYYFDQ